MQNKWKRIRQESPAIADNPTRSLSKHHAVHLRTARL